MRALARKSERRTDRQKRRRTGDEKPLTKRQLLVRRLFHRAEARVETLPPFSGMLMSAAFIGSFALYGMILGGQFKNLVNDTTAALGFEVEAVKISGHAYLEEREILDLLDLKPGISLITLSAAEAQRTLLAEPWVKAVSVRKIYPGRLHITLEEKKPFAIWQRGQIASVIDEAGTELDRFNETRHGALPIFVGHGAQRAGAGFHEMLQLFPTLSSRVRASFLRSNRRWDLLLDNGVIVKLPERAPERAMARLMTLETSDNVLAKDVEIIDLRLDDRLVMRLSDEAVVSHRAAVQRRRDNQRHGENI